MFRHLKLGVLASGNGSNLQAIIDAIKSGSLFASIAVVISDQKDAFALKRAEEHRIPTKIIQRKNYASKEFFEAEIDQTLKMHDVSWVVLAGFMRILSADFLKHYPNRVLNIHPALLPAFPGLDAVGQAFRYGVRCSGCTVHLVDEGCDTGPILGQEPVFVSEDDTLESLTQKIHTAEHQLYPKILKRLVTETIEVVGRKVRWVVAETLNSD